MTNKKANDEINGLTFKVFVIMMVFGLGVILGRWQSKEWSVIDKHKTLEEDAIKKLNSQTKLKVKTPLNSK
jgi:hypothetical protein